MVTTKKISVFLLIAAIILSIFSFSGVFKANADGYSLIENTGMAVEADSELDATNHPVAYLIDYYNGIRPEPDITGRSFTGPNNRIWFSNARASEFAGKWYSTVILDLGMKGEYEYYKVSKIAITPALYTKDSVKDETFTDACPRKFVVYTSKDKINWSEGVTREITDLHEVKSYKVNGNDPNKKYASDIGVAIEETEARYIKYELYAAVDADPTGSERGGASLVKLQAVKAFETNNGGSGSSAGISGGIQGEGDTAIEVFASSENTKRGSVGEFSPANLIDGPTEDDKVNEEIKVKLWCSEWMNTSSKSTDEYIEIVSRGKMLSYSGITLYGNHFNSGFPEELKIQYSFDGLDFVTAYTYKDIDNPDARADFIEWQDDGKPSSYFVPEKNYRPNYFTFDKPIICDVLRVQFVQKGADIEGNYVVVIAEMTVDREVATDAAVENAKAEYLKKLEEMSKSNSISDDEGKIMFMIYGSGGIVLIGIIVFGLSFIKTKQPVGPDGQPIKRRRKTKEEKEREMLVLIFGERALRNCKQYKTKENDKDGQEHSDDKKGDRL